MKKLIIFLFIFIASIAYSKEIIITTGEWEPHFGKNLKGGGAGNWIVSDILKDMGYTVTFRYYPWARAIMSSKRIDIFGTCCWSKNTNRTKNFYITQGILSSTWVFWHKKSLQFDWKTLENLAKYKIGATLSYSYSEKFRNMARRGMLQVEWVPYDKQNFRKLMMGRVDLFMNDILVGKMQIQKTFHPNKWDIFTYHKKYLNKRDYGLLINKRWQNALYEY